MIFVNSKLGERKEVWLILKYYTVIVVGTVIAAEEIRSNRRLAVQLKRKYISSYCSGMWKIAFRWTSHAEFFTFATSLT